MPNHPRSLLLTDAYRGRMVGLRERVERQVSAAWQKLSLDDLDATYPLWAMVGSVSTAQREGARLSNAYLSAFLSLELGRRVRTATFDSEPYVGKSRDGRPLEEALLSPLIGVKAAISEDDPLKTGLERALRMVSVDTDHATRKSLTDAMAAEGRIAGWRRAVRGTCGACLGEATESLLPPGFDLRIHPNCQCISEPVVKNVSDRHPRPSGREIFNSLSPAAQNAALGVTAATQVRAGEIELADLVATSALATQADFITQGPPPKSR